MSSVRTELDITALTRAIEARDAEGQVAAYAPDARLTVIDHEHPPTHPLEVTGTAGIRAYLDDICARDMTHQVSTAVHSGDRAAIEVACAYPDGTRVLCLSVAGLSEGRIAWQRIVQAWDH